METQLRALGGLRLEPVLFKQPKPLLLLSYLSIEGPKPKRHLAELFWPEGNKMKSLSMTLTRIRQSAGNVVEVSDKQTQSMLSSDVKDLLESLDKSDWEKASAQYAGAFLEGITLEDWGSELEEWVYTTREYLAERVQYALLNLSEDAARKQDFNKAAELAERAYKLPGLSGSDVANLKRLYPLLCAGKSVLAPIVRKEAEGYGLILELTTESARALYKPEALSKSQTLPLRGTSFVGRDAELKESTSLLAKSDIRLLSLIGPGGAGKTRIALQLAHNQQQSKIYKHGVYFVPLETLTDAGLIPVHLITHFGLTQQAKQDPLEQVIDFISDNHILLILDNFEQLNKDAVYLTDLLNKCPNLKLLVTSRERLRLEEEHSLEIGGLKYAVDNALGDATQLFKERAQQVKPRFDLHTNLTDVLRICELVDGLPLAIELAAAWIRLLTCQEIAQELQSNLDLLSSTNINTPDRQRSLKAVFEHSWQLLSLKEQEVLRKLSVFRGGFKREAASEVTGATIANLASLVDKSLLRVLPNGRYDRHPLLYQFTQEKLELDTEEANYTRAKHADYFVNQLVATEPELTGDQQRQWLTNLDQDYDNLRAVLDWALKSANRNTKGLELASALHHFWYLRGYFSEGRNWLDAFLAREMYRGLPYLKALYASARLTREQGDYNVAKSSFKTCIQLGQELGAKDIVSKSWEGLGGIAHERGDYATAHTFHEQSLALERILKNDSGISSSLNNLGAVAYYQRDFPKAHTFFEEGLMIRRKLGDGAGISASLNNLGLVALGQEDAASARAYFEEGLAIQKILGDKRSLALTYSNMAILEEGIGNYSNAKLLATESLKIVVEIGYKRGATLLLGSLADLAAASKEFEKAALLWGTLEKLRKITDIPLHPNDKAEYEQNVSAARMQIDDETFTRAWAKGMEMTLEQVLDLSLTTKG